MNAAKLQYTYDQFLNPVLQALRSLGGSGTNEEIDNKVAETMGIPPEQVELLHNPEKGGMTEFEYRIAWTRTYLKKYGLIENSTRGVWSLTASGTNTDRVDEKTVVHSIRAQLKREDRKASDEDVPAGEVKWQEELMDILQKMPPSAFERLIQRMLRESGFIQVEVTGRSGDGGIDGQGIMRLGGFLSFRVSFQCKRWRGTVGSGVVRDFRGAMVGRADKGLLITTGTFSQDAKKEATRDGAPAIDLVDADQLVQKLKELALGVLTKQVMREEVVVVRSLFDSI